MARKAKNGMATGGRLSGGQSFRPRTVPLTSWVRIRLPSSGNRDLIAVGRRLLVGNGEQRQRHAAGGVPARLDRRELGGLIFERVEAVLVAQKDLQRHENGQQPQRHRQHRARFGDEPLAQQIEGADADHDEAGGDVEADHRVRQPIRERRVEDDLHPRLRVEAPVDRSRSRPASASSYWRRESRRTKTACPPPPSARRRNAPSAAPASRPNSSTPRNADSRKNAVRPS